MAKGQRALLPPEDEERLKQLAEGGTAALQHRAQAILAWHEGLTASETAKRTKLTVNQVQYLWRLYRLKGLDLFMVDTEPIPAETPSAPAPAVSEPEDTRLSLESLCANYSVDLPHARHVGGLALQIFDATSNMHRLPQNVRSLLEAAALVHNIAYEIDPPNHHLRGRDILMAQPLRSFTDDERRILACTTSFHRKKVRPEAEPVYMELPEELRRDALALSAVLRVADGLDASQTQSTRITDVQTGAGEVIIVVNGPQARSDSEQAQKKADLWNRVFAVQVRLVTTVPEVEPEPEPAFKLASPSESNAAITVAHIGRTFALHTLDRMETLFRHVRSDDMSAMPALAREASRLVDAIALANLKGFGKEARWLADLIEEAHVAIAVAERLAALGDEGAVSSAAAARSWKEQARSAIQSIDLKRSTGLLNNLRAALNEKIEVDESLLLAYQIGPLLWAQLSELRRVMEHGSNVKEALETVYRLCDYLLSFREFLGPEVAQVLDILAPLESYLAAIQMTQAVMARLEPRTVKKGRKTVTLSADPASEALRGTQVELLEMLADNLPAIWTGVNSVVFRRSFGLAVAVP